MTDDPQPEAASPPQRYGRQAGGDEAEADVRVAQSIYAAFERLDVEAALVFCHDDVVMNPPGTAALAGRDAPYVGHAGIRQFFADADRVWQTLTLHARDFRASAGSVVVFGWVGGVSMDGERIAREVVWVWRVRDGRAASVQVSDLRERTDPGGS